jgi:hypothetical protein
MEKYITSKLVSLVCVIGAIIVMRNGGDGWGWLLFIALCAL